MPRSFFRDNLKDGGKKTAADDQRSIDRILHEEMNRAAHAREVVRAREAKKNGASAPVQSDDAAQAEEKKTAAAIAEKLGSVPLRAPVHVAECCSLVESATGVVLKAGPYYDDVSVCRILGIRRRVIAAARTQGSRGRDWDCVGEHAGMSRDWVAMKMLEIGKPVTDLGMLKPIEENDGVVSVKLMGCWPNVQRVTVERFADGAKELATVKDSREMHLNDIFDCKRFGNSLYMVPELNACQY